MNSVKCKSKGEIMKIEEYDKILEKMEEALSIFEEMKKYTRFLKAQYNKNPGDEELLKDIKLHEENFKALYEEFQALNKKAQELSKK